MTLAEEREQKLNKRTYIKKAMQKLKKERISSAAEGVDMVKSDVKLEPSELKSSEVANNLVVAKENKIQSKTISIRFVSINIEK